MVNAGCLNSHLRTEFGDLQNSVFYITGLSMAQADEYLQRYISMIKKL